MSKGQEQVQVALAVCRNAWGEVGELALAEQVWKNEAAKRLERIDNVLDGVKDKFFLRTKLCLPFASRCEKEARRLEETLRRLEARADENDQQQFISALDSLERAAKALKERSDMQGMAIT